MKKPYYYQRGEDYEIECIGFAENDDEALNLIDTSLIYEMSVVDVMDINMYQSMRDELDEEDVKKLDDYFGRYIRTKTAIKTKNDTVRTKSIIKKSNQIEDLIIGGDLLFVEDRSKKNYVVVPYIYNDKAPLDIHSPAYKVKALYIRDSKGNYQKVAEDKSNGKLELL